MTHPGFFCFRDCGAAALEAFYGQVLFLPKAEYA